MLLALTLLLPPLAAYLIGRGAGNSSFRRERIAGIVAGAALPILFWLVSLLVQWSGPEMDADSFRYAVIAGGTAVVVLTPPCLLFAWLGNRRAVRLRQRIGRSDRFG